MNFGDWPAWIALALAIVSPVINSFFNNRHAERMEKIKREADAADSVSTLIAELINTSTTQVGDFHGFTGKAMSSLSICDVETIDSFFKGINSIERAAEFPYTDELVYQQWVDKMPYQDWVKEITIRLISNRNVALQRKSWLERIRTRLTRWFHNPMPRQK